jgi:hypothetical protein
VASGIFVAATNYSHLWDARLIGPVADDTCYTLCT